MICNYPSRLGHTVSRHNQGSIFYHLGDLLSENNARTVSKPPAEARIAMGGVALKPWRARAAEQILIGARADTALIQRAAKAALVDAKPSGDNAFKIELARRVVARALALAAAGMPALPGSPFAGVSGALTHA